MPADAISPLLNGSSGLRRRSSKSALTPRARANGPRRPGRVSPTRSCRRSTPRPISLVPTWHAEHRSPALGDALPPEGGNGHSGRRRDVTCFRLPSSPPLGTRSPQLERQACQRLGPSNLEGIEKEIAASRKTGRDVESTAALLIGV